MTINKKSISILFSLCTFVTLNLFSINSFADQHDDECSIWLCLPTGFPDGCDGAKSEMKKRIRHLKSPLPDLQGCLVSDSGSKDDDSNIRASDGIAAYIPPHTSCARWGYLPSANRQYEQKTCLEYINYEKKMIKDVPCIPPLAGANAIGESYQANPAYCTQTIKYVDVFIDGEKTGETYYFDNNGDEY